jgi:predicted nucleotidyltransferase
MKSPLIVAFGSQVKGGATSKSDFDFGVLGEGQLSLAERTDLAYHIAQKMNM